MNIIIPENKFGLEPGVYTLESVADIISFLVTLIRNTRN